MHIAFLTCEKVPNLVPSDKLVADYLIQQGITCSTIVWNDPTIEFETYDALILRSVWDYHIVYDQWAAFLDKLEAENCKVLNPASVLRWNSHKNYLKNVIGSQLQIPLKIIKQGTQVNLHQLMKSENWEKVVIKPTVSASGYKTWTCGLSEAKNQQLRFVTSSNERELIVQQFAPEVVEDGEWSLVFFNKKYSHAVLKNVKKGDFRVQSDYGGTTTVLEPPKMAQEMAQKILNDLPDKICYARVDGIIRGDKFYLMELELVEPELFISEIPGSEKRFGAAILNCLAEK